MAFKEAQYVGNHIAMTAQHCSFYFATFSITVLKEALPFFGVTVTVTLHDPVLRPLRVLPETLQNFAELGATFRVTFDVEATFNFA